MYSLRFFQSNSAKARSISQPQVRSYLSQTFLSLKSTATRAPRLACDVQIFTASKIRPSTLRTRVFEKNAQILAKENSRCFGTTRLLQINHLRVNTEVINNVYLYKYERPLFFNVMTITAGLQFFIWSAVSYSIYKLLPERNPNETSITQYAYDNWFYIGFIVLPIVAAIAGSSLLWMFISRSIRYIILNKGGKTVTLITYHPLAKKIITVPLTDLRCKLSRKEMLHYMPIKMYGRRFFYILDRGGVFVNPTLFDYTVGATRS